MDCVEIRRAFARGLVPEGPAVAEHVRLCPPCRELFEKGAELGQRLAQGALPPVEAPELLAAVERDLQAEVGAHAWLRALPTWSRAGVLVALGVGLLVLHLRFDRRGDLNEYGLDVFAMVTLGLLVALTWGAARLLRGVSRPTGGEVALALVLLGLPVLLMLVVPLGALDGDATPDWGRPSECFGYGSALVLPIVALAWLFERRDHVPLGALAAVGALAGIAANLLLNAHCASMHLGHLMLGHASIGVAWALALLLLSPLLRPKE